MGALDSLSSWVIVVLAIAIILFFLCLVICLNRDDLNVMKKNKNGDKYVSPRKKSLTKISKDKKYEQCNEAISIIAESVNFMVFMIAGYQI